MLLVIDLSAFGYDKIVLWSANTAPKKDKARNVHLELCDSCKFKDKK